MTGQLVDPGATVSCSHGGTARPIPTQTRVWIAGQPVITLDTPYVMTDCPVDDESARCVSGRWVDGAARVLADGTPVALQSGGSMTSPSGAAMIASVVQQRVSAS